MVNSVNMEKDLPRGEGMFKGGKMKAEKWYNLDKKELANQWIDNQVP